MHMAAEPGYGCRLAHCSVTMARLIAGLDVHMFQPRPGPRAAVVYAADDEGGSGADAGPAADAAGAGRARARPETTCLDSAAARFVARSACTSSEPVRLCQRVIGALAGLTWNDY
jgi:hypothetical protein